MCQKHNISIIFVGSMDELRNVELNKDHPSFIAVYPVPVGDLGSSSILNVTYHCPEEDFSLMTGILSELGYKMVDWRGLSWVNPSTLSNSEIKERLAERVKSIASNDDTLLWVVE